MRPRDGGHGRPRATAMTLSSSNRTGGRRGGASWRADAPRRRPARPVSRRWGVRAGLVLAALVALATPAQAQGPAGIVEYYGTDAIGSVRVVFDQAGAVVARSDYGPFGEEINGGVTLPPIRFTAQERDPEAGLDYFNARFLQPRAGRFASVDPVFSEGAQWNPQLWNRYVYALN